MTQMHSRSIATALLPALTIGVFTTTSAFADTATTDGDQVVEAMP